MNNITNTEKFIELGFNVADAKKINELACSHEYGALNIVSGPKSSDKTKTLKAIIETIIANEQCRVTTLEYPPEDQIKGAIHVTARPETDAFRLSILTAMRTNPEVIVISSIHDKDRALGAVQAAMSGHRVWATVDLEQDLSESATIDYLTGLGVPAELICGVVMLPR